MKTVCALVFCVLVGRTATADPITATLEGCVSVHDPRLSLARWSAVGTFQAVAFDSAMPGCAPTIAHALTGAYEFDEDRVQNTLAAWLDLSALPTCGRRQYDVHYYLEGGVLDPFGLKSLVIDTGRACAAGTNEASGSIRASGNARVPEPAVTTLFLVAVFGTMARWQRRPRQKTTVRPTWARRSGWSRRADWSG